MIRCIAVDDEPLALRQIKSYISRIDFLTLVGSFTSATQARAFVESEQVDLMFLDINMPDMTGLEMLRDIAPERRPLTVFTTAYSDYAIDGFKLEALDYLLKPFSFSEFSIAAQRAKSRMELVEGARVEESDEDAVLGSSGADTLSIKVDRRMVILKLHEVEYVGSEGEYMRVHMADGKVYTTFARLKSMEDALPADMFMRVHRSYIVNLNLMTGFNRGRVFFGDDSEGIPIGDNYKESFQGYVDRKFGANAKE